MKDDKTHFGFETVSEQEKTRRVRGVFDSVADSYDVMNDLMSLGVHRLWKRYAIEISGVRPGHRTLDLAGGTGDLTKLIAQRVGNEGEMILSDINGAMLSNGRDVLTDSGIAGNVHFVQIDAEELPFQDNYFDLITIGFGLRNVTRPERAMQSMARVLKPGGRLIVLEFSTPTTPLLNKVYDFYSDQLLPRIGKIVANDADSYRYLVESIRMHPDQDTLKQRLLDNGFDRCEYFNLSGGIVAIHRAIKL